MVRILILAAVLLPALRAEETDERDQLHAVVLGVLMFAANHDGATPKDLAALSAEMKQWEGQTLTPFLDGEIGKRLIYVRPAADAPADHLTVIDPGAAGSKPMFVALDAAVVEIPSERTAELIEQARKLATDGNAARTTLRLSERMVFEGERKLQPRQEWNKDIVVKRPSKLVAVIRSMGPKHLLLIADRSYQALVKDDHGGVHKEDLLVDVDLADGETRTPLELPEGRYWFIIRNDAPEDCAVRMRWTTGQPPRPGETAAGEAPAAAADAAHVPTPAAHEPTPKAATAPQVKPAKPENQDKPEKPAKAEKPEAPKAAVACREIRLADGRTLIGTIDEAHTEITLVSEKTGKAMATMHVDPRDVISVTDRPAPKP